MLLSEGRSTSDSVVINTPTRIIERTLQLTIFKFTNEGLEALGDLTQFTSIKWPTAFIGCGSFEIWAPINSENSGYFKKGNIVWSNTEIAAIIECVKSTVDEDGNESFDVKGRTIERFLMDRIIWGTVTYTNKKASTIMYDIVDKNCIHPTNPNRVIPWLENEEDTFIGNTVDSYQKTGGSVYDTIYSIAVESDIGFTVYPDQEKRKMMFSVRKGSDRTVGNTEGNDPVVFETALQDILSSSYYTNSEDLKNVAFVQGEDKGEERKSVTVGDSTLFGLDRKELYVDARDVQSEVYDEEGQSTVIPDPEYLQMLSQRGSEKLSEYMTIETFEAQIRQFGDVQYEYGVDFYLGDKVTVIDEELGVSVSARILSVEEDMSDKYEITLNFGYSYPTILQKAKREFS